jgi:hypothetical protein
VKDVKCSIKVAGRVQKGCLKGAIIPTKGMVTISTITMCFKDTTYKLPWLSIHGFAHSVIGLQCSAHY